MKIHLRIEGESLFYLEYLKTFWFQKLKHNFLLSQIFSSAVIKLEANYDKLFDFLFSVSLFPFYFCLKVNNWQDYFDAPTSPLKIFTIKRQSISTVSNAHFFFHFSPSPPMNIFLNLHIFSMTIDSFSLIYFVHPFFFFFSFKLSNLCFS